MSISDDLLEQTEQCLKNIAVALQQADATLKDVVQVLYILPNASEFEHCWPVLQRCFGDVRPAATMISAQLGRPENQDRNSSHGTKVRLSRGQTAREARFASGKAWVHTHNITSAALG